jgi:hypothetical protein
MPIRYIPQLLLTPQLTPVLQPKPGLRCGGYRSQQAMKLCAPVPAAGEPVRIARERMGRRIDASVTSYVLLLYGYFTLKKRPDEKNHWQQRYTKTGKSSGKDGS